MPTVLSFDEFLWAEHIDSDEPSWVRDLHDVTSSGCSDQQGDFAAERVPGGLLVRGPLSQTALLLVSERAREAFRKRLEGFAERGGFEGDVASWAGFEEAMANPLA